MRKPWCRAWSQKYRLPDFHRRHLDKRSGGRTGQDPAGAGGRRDAQTGRLGFELFDKPNWAGSDFSEQVNYQRALEGELERTIQTLGKR